MKIHENQPKTEIIIITTYINTVKFNKGDKVIGKPWDIDAIKSEARKSAKKYIESQADSKKIICVEDDPNIADIMNIILDQEGYDVTTASESTEALSIIQAHPNKYDLLITDLNLSDMSGIELAMSIKKISPDITALLSTGDSNINSQELKSSNSIDDVILKPFFAKDFLWRVKKLLREEAC